MTYSVIVVHQDGERDVRASNVTLERAQAVQAIFSPRFPAAQVLIEPQHSETRPSEPQPVVQEECLFPPGVQPQNKNG